MFNLHTNVTCFSMYMINGLYVRYLACVTITEASCDRLPSARHSHPGHTRVSGAKQFR